jgi:vancomycin resistance protein YoaR
MPGKYRVPILISGLVIILLLAFFIGNYLIWRQINNGQIYPGVWVGNINLSGKSLAEAENIIKAQAQKIEDDGLKFQYDKRSETLPNSVVSFDSDLAYQYWSIDIVSTAQDAWGTGGDRTFGNYLLAYWHLKKPRIISSVYSLDEEKIQEFLNSNFPELNIPPVNAFFSVTGSKKIGWKLRDNPEQIGKEINYQEALGDLKNNLSALQENTINLKTHSKYPTIKQADLTALEDPAQNLIDRGGLTLQLVATSTKYWEIGPEKIITWVSAESSGNQITLTLDQDKIKQYLQDFIAPELDQEALAPRFAVVDGRVTSWQNGRDGFQIDSVATAAEITSSFLSGQNKINLITKVALGDNAIATNNLNITEIIGTGSSNFVGSPTKRLHNIAVGAAAVQGLLIKPNEEFSLIKALGEISDKTGYLQELVIKGNKTTPEYGGGLCQIGTTMFRVALASGLPITMRQNHSYRVSYYEPAGTDATIYDPLPDLRFINDTGNYILIQSRIVKTHLYFDFWGTSDGRVATTTAPVIYNIVKPEPTKIIPSPDLKPGEKKCTESSHNGADAYFDYTVTYPAGSTTTPVQTRRFKSHYVPWQAVCLVGETASSTATIATSSPTASAYQKAAGTSTATSSNEVKP